MELEYWYIALAVAAVFLVFKFVLKPIFKVMAFAMLACGIVAWLVWGGIL